MNFKLSEEHLMIRQAARDFANNECLPGVIERDENQKFPHEQVMKLADLGIRRFGIGYYELCNSDGRNK
jgi:alkylation response protein AidB-like acyl-CoA dehydrogenase